MENRVPFTCGDMYEKLILINPTAGSHNSSQKPKNALDSSVFDFSLKSGTKTDDAYWKAEFDLKSLN